MAFPFRVSPVNIVNWYADCRIGFRFFTTSSLVGYADLLITKYIWQDYICICIKGDRHFPSSYRNRNLKLTLPNPGLSSYPLGVAIQSCRIVLGNLSLSYCAMFPYRLSPSGKAGRLTRYLVW